jgi:hypothetical protein
LVGCRLQHTETSASLTSQSIYSPPPTAAFATDQREARCYFVEVRAICFWSAAQFGIFMTGGGGGGGVPTVFDRLRQKHAGGVRWRDNISWSTIYPEACWEWRHIRRLVLNA